MDKEILVAEVYNSHGTASISIDEHSPLDEVVRTFAEQPWVRGIFLVDADRCFVGMITRADLLKWVGLQFPGGRVMSRSPNWETLRLLEAKKARDLASRYGRRDAIKENDTLPKALEDMLLFEEDILPVLDDEGRVLGDLRLSEILSWLHSSGKLQQ